MFSSMTLAGNGGPGYGRRWKLLTVSSLTTDALPVLGAIAAHNLVLSCLDHAIFA
jgi:hypothetical protein